MSGGTRDIGRYRVAELIGRGGFGAVYRALDEDHSRNVAIKVLQGTLGETERRRFDRERKAMGRLGAHPNIISVYESGYTDLGEGYIVMELATGGSLRQQLETAGPMPWNNAVAIMIAISSAIQVAHDNGVLHRDIKPDNILVDEFGYPKLTDFGIAAVASIATATTSTATTAVHAAPEVLQGHTAAESVDVYAIGSTLHTLVAGVPPFTQPNDEAVAAIITRTLTQPPPDLRPLGIPDPVASVIERALAKEPSERQVSAGALAIDLQAAAEAAVTGASVTVEANGSMWPDEADPTRRIAAGETVSADGPPTMLASQFGALTPTQAQPISAETVGRAGPPINSGAVGSSPQRQRGRSWAIWVPVATVVAGAFLVGAILLARAQGSIGNDIATGDTNPGVSTTEVAPEGNSLTTGPAPVETTTTTTTTTTTVTTAAPLLISELTDSASARASSRSSSGVDGCGASTSYQAANLLDRRDDTAWRTGGDGQSEWIEIRLDGTYQITEIGIIPGYDKVDDCDGTDRFTQNRRIEEIRWTIGNQTVSQQLNVDDRSMQTSVLEKPVPADTIRLEIVSATGLNANGRDFVAISELFIAGG